jgi:hypothetical protein
MKLIRSVGVKKHAAQKWTNYGLCPLSLLLAPAGGRARARPRCGDLGLRPSRTVSARRGSRRSRKRSSILMTSRPSPSPSSAAARRPP